MSDGIEFKGNGVTPGSPVAGFLVNYGTPTVQVAKFGAAPPTTGAIRADASSYAGQVCHFKHTTQEFDVEMSATLTTMGTLTAHPMRFHVNTESKWSMENAGAGISTLKSIQATTRFVGGSSGVAFRDSTDANANLSITDGGNVSSRQSITAGASNQAFIVNTRSSVGSPNDGYLRFANNAGTDFLGTQYGGGTSSFPMWARSGAYFSARLADDSAYTGVRFARITLHGAADAQAAGVVSFGNATQTTVGAAGGASALPATPTGYLRFFLGATEYVWPYYPAS